MCGLKQVLNEKKIEPGANRLATCSIYRQRILTRKYLSFGVTGPSKDPSTDFAYAMGLVFSFLFSDNFALAYSTADIWILLIQ